jgi:hypothetical protein
MSGQGSILTLAADIPKSDTWYPTPEGAIAQLGERVNGIHEVGGSIPPGSTKFLQWHSSAETRVRVRAGSGL